MKIIIEKKHSIMARSSAQILDDDEELDLLDFMLEACGIDYYDEFTDDKRVFTREIFENNMDVLLKMFENRSFQRAPYFVIGYLFLITGARMPLGLKEDLLENTKWKYEKDRWLDEDFKNERKICIKDFREKIRAQTYGLRLHTIDNLYGGFSDVVIDINQLKEGKEGKLNDVKHVSLDGWGLKSVPREVFSLTQLESLSFRYNYLEEIPEEILRLKHLKYLSLSYNRIKTLPATFFKNLEKLSSLQFLYLDHNLISYLPESVVTYLGKPSSLEWLFLEYNLLKTIPTHIKIYRRPKIY